MENGRIIIEVTGYVDDGDLLCLDDKIPSMMAGLLITGVYINNITKNRIELNIPYHFKPTICHCCGQKVERL